MAYNPSHYRYSYSGSDAHAYAYVAGRADRAALLESMHTISWSVHEGKGQARALGFRGIRGLAKGVRTIAGSMIMTVIEDNPLAPLMDMLADIYLDPTLRWEGWSMDWKDVGIGSGIDTTTFNRRLASTLPPFDLLVQYVAEGSTWSTQETTTSIPGAACLIQGIEFIDEGMVTSTSDSATEMTYSFIARDCKTISKQQFDQKIDPFAGQDPALIRAAMLRQLLQGPSRALATTYKTQTNPAQPE
jgi:hypothetical protein